MMETLRVRHLTLRDSVPEILGSSPQRAIPRCGSSAAASSKASELARSRCGAPLALVCYVIFPGTFVDAIGFVTNLIVPASIDSPPTASLGYARLVNVLLLGAFAVQHSGMARQG